MTSRVPLRRLLHRQEGAEALLTAVSEALGGPVAVEDADGRIVYGPAGDGAARVPVTVDDQVLGWVRGSERDAAAVVALVDAWRLVTSSRRRSAPRCCTSIARST